MIKYCAAFRSAKDVFLSAKAKFYCAISDVKKIVII